MRTVTGLVIALLTATIVALNMGPVDLKKSTVKQVEPQIVEEPLTSSPGVKSFSPGDKLVYIYGVIDEDSAVYATEQLLELGVDSKPITILINSPGGSVIAGASIISAIQAARGPVNTVCVQICASMAAMIHQYGTNRLMLDRSIIMFHPASGGADGEVDKVASRINLYKEVISEMEQNVATRSRMTYSEYKFKSGTELWLTAKSAYSAHVADSIVVIRGASAGKLFPQPRGIFGKVNTPPFTVPTNTINKDLYWISSEAVNLFGRSK